MRRRCAGEDALYHHAAQARGPAVQLGAGGAVVRHGVLQPGLRALEVVVLGGVFGSLRWRLAAAEARRVGAHARAAWQVREAVCPREARQRAVQHAELRRGRAVRRSARPRHHGGRQLGREGLQHAEGSCRRDRGAGPTAVPRRRRHARGRGGVRQRRCRSRRHHHAGAQRRGADGRHGECESGHRGPAAEMGFCQLGRRFNRRHADA
mmetsp:Transcript_48684/g.155566  ORF Transcript_48684/g.155566 Transcript_48684/m.155566 type:complete len:208 (-) Transcript_48684:708-1331(-)